MKSQHLPKFCFSGRTLKPQGIVLHHFSCKNVDPDKTYDLEACRNLMVDLNRIVDDRIHYLKNKTGRDAKRCYASAHVFIGRKGECWKLIDYDKQAYHAGVSSLNGRMGCNRHTVGIELIGDATSGFTDEQYWALAKISKHLMNKYDFDIDSIAGHDQVRYEAILNGKSASYKYDPSGSRDGKGDNFNWDTLFQWLDAG